MEEDYVVNLSVNLKRLRQDVIDSLPGGIPLEEKVRLAEEKVEQELRLGNYGFYLGFVR